MCLNETKLKLVQIILDSDDLLADHLLEYIKAISIYPDEPEQEDEEPEYTEAEEDEDVSFVRRAAKPVFTWG